MIIGMIRGFPTQDPMAGLIPADLLGLAGRLVVAAGALRRTVSSLVPARKSSAVGAAGPMKLIGSIGAWPKGPVGVARPGEMADQAAVTHGQHVGPDAVFHSGQQPAHGAVAGPEGGQLIGMHVRPGFQHVDGPA